jgi:Spy/CpxP family protein refolding chaperone
MKKALVVAALVVGMGFFGWQQASAERGMGGSHGKGGMGMKGGPACSQLDTASKAKLDKFHNETKDLRKQMVMKRAEERAVLSSTNPDPATAAKLAGELFDLKAAIQAKAEAAGVQGLMGCGSCQGPGQGMGPHHGGGRGMMNAGPDDGTEVPDAPAGGDAQ